MATFHKELIVRGQKVILRNAGPEDAEELIALIRQVDTETEYLMREPGEFDFTVEQEEAFIRSRMDAPLQRLAVAGMDEKIVGVASALIGGQRRIRHTGSVGIMILKAYWEKGIGRTLLEENVGWMAQNGVERVELTVDTQNVRAIALYMRLGFVVEGTLRRDRKLADGTYRDAYQMALDVKEYIRNDG